MDIPWAPSWLGSGQPGDDNVQYGVNIQLLSKDGDDAYNSTADLHFYNHSVDFISSADYMPAEGGYEVTYTTEIQNVGTEDAYDIWYELYPESTLQIQNIDIAGPESVQATRKSADDRRTASPRSGSPETGIILNFEMIPAGQTVTVTVTGLYPLDMETLMFDIYCDLYGFDGQVDRGVWWLDMYDLFQGMTYLPDHHTVKFVARSKNISSAIR